jgi:hypothetical protein
MNKSILWAPLLLVLFATQASAQDSTRAKIACDTLKNAQEGLKATEALSEFSEPCIPLDNEILFSFSDAHVVESDAVEFSGGSTSNLLIAGFIPIGREYGEVILGKGGDKDKERIKPTSSAEGVLRLSFDADKASGTGSLTLSDLTKKFIEKEKKRRYMGTELKKADGVCVSGVSLRGSVTQYSSGIGIFAGEVLIFLNGTEHGHRVLFPAY